MADVTIEASCYGNIHERALRCGPFWTSPTVGYVIFIDSFSNINYRKTEDGGATWAASQRIETGTVLCYDCWADWQTAGDAGTKIHIVFIESDDNIIYYTSLDTSTDTVASDVAIEACRGSGVFKLYEGWLYNLCSITKTRGGNLAVAIRYEDSVATNWFSFYTSPDGTTWTSKTNPWESAPADRILLFPANLADNQDLWGVYWDASSDFISLKTFDNSANSWSETLFEAAVESTVFYQMDGQVRLSDGHLIFACWNAYNVGTADLAVWDINGAGSITPKANVITNTAEYALASVLINQANDDIYVAYAGGTDFTSLVKAFYKKSVDGGGSWGGETALQANAEDDERWISCGAVKEAWGGKFQPVWFNDDLDDLFTNTDNGISIASLAPTATSTVIPKILAAGVI